MQFNYKVFLIWYRTGVIFLARWNKMEWEKEGRKEEGREERREWGRKRGSGIKRSRKKRKREEKWWKVEAKGNGRRERDRPLETYSGAHQMYVSHHLMTIVLKVTSVQLSLFCFFPILQKILGTWSREQEVKLFNRCSHQHLPQRGL